MYVRVFFFDSLFQARHLMVVVDLQICTAKIYYGIYGTLHLWGVRSRDLASNEL